jgi:hypothetical protein
MKKWILFYCTVLPLAAAIAGCGSVKVVLDQNWSRDQKPSYVDYMDYYWWGLKGKPALNLQAVCLDQKPLAFQRVRTGEDITIGIFTLGIYLPATVRVWCGG